MYVPVDTSVGYWHAYVVATIGETNTRKDKLLLL